MATGQDVPADGLPQVNNESETSDSHDSAYGDDDSDRSLLMSITSSVYQYRKENGRTYHAYKDGQYAYPNDDQEQDRLDLQHQLFLLSFENKLYLAPIKENPQKVLDLGTGTGLWAMDFGQFNCLYMSFPGSGLTGTIPPNLSFEIDDANEPWVYSGKFDFIHCRQHHCAINEKRTFEQAMEFLQPGGWIEMQELAFPLGCDDGTIDSDSALYKWSNLMLEASRIVGQDLSNASRYGKWMKEAGFENVHATMYKWPGNDWPKGKAEKLRGLWMMQNHLDGLHGFTMGFFTRVHGWSPEEVEVFLAHVRKDIKDRNIHMWWPVWVVYGQKPEALDDSAA